MKVTETPWTLLEDWRKSMHFSKTQCWKLRKRGALNATKIAGKLFLHSEEIGRFNDAAAAGEIDRV